MIDGIVLKNIKSGVEIPIHREDTPDYILNYVDWGQIQGSQYTYKYSKQVGVYVVSTSLETRAVTIAGWIIAPNNTAMTERKAKLNAFVNPQEDIQITYKNKFLIFSPSTTIQYARENERDNNNVIAQFKISGTAANPLFMDQNENRTESGNYQAAFHFPLIINDTDIQDSEDVEQHHPLPTIMFAVKERSRLMLITNNGTVPIGMQIILEANGEVVNPVITNINTQEFYQINKTMIAGEQIDINTMIGSKHILGKVGSGEWSNYFRYRDFDSTWLQLEVGDNIFAYDAESGGDNLEVTIEFNNGYLEVEECY